MHANELQRQHGGIGHRGNSATLQLFCIFDWLINFLCATPHRRTNRNRCMHGKRTHFKNRVYKAEVIAKSGF